MSRSPLSDLVEFEFIATAVLAKRAGFETLREVAAVDARLDAALLERFIAQADKQHHWLADARREVAARVFGGDPGPADEAALEGLIAQADKQHDWLADVRREVAAEVFGGHPAPADAAADS